MAQGIEYHVRAILEAQGGKKAMTRMQKFASGWMKSSQRIESMGRTIAGNTLQTAGLMAKAAGSAALLAGAAGMGAAVVSAVHFNKELENTQYAMATTLQLMDHSADTFQKAVDRGLSPGAAAAEQLGANLKVAEGTMDRLFRIAAKSPASFQQAQTMFSNMLPGARSVTGNMERIEELAKNSLALGMVMGGDFQTTGAQMSRILTGGAGAEFETWKVLQKPILEAGKAAGYFGEQMAMGQKLTQEFNQLSPEKRMELVEKATEKLGVATEAYGTTWAGLTSTIISDLQLIQKAFGKATFDKLKSRFKSLVGEGGVLDPEGETMRKLEFAASQIGERFADFIDAWVGRVIPYIEYVADNWPDIAARFQDAFDKGIRMAKMLLRFAAARAILGGGMMAAGKAGGMVGAAGKGIGKAHGTITKLIGNLGKLGGSAGSLAQLGPAIMGISSAALFAIPVLLVLGAAMLGAFAVVGGAIAYFVSQWDEIVMSFNNGTLTLAPLLDALEVAWSGFVRLGGALFGGTNAASSLQSVIYFVTDAVYFLLAAFALGMKTLGAFQFLFNAFTAGLKMVYLGFVAIGQGVVWAIREMITGVANMLARISERAAAPLRKAASGVDAAYQAIGAHTQDVMKSVQQDAKESTNLWNAADKILEGQSEGKFREGFDQYVKKMGEGAGQAMGPGGGGPDAPGAPKGGNTHIHKMVVNQDLRNQDPDRVIGAFYRAVDNAVTKRTQSTALPQGGL